MDLSRFLEAQATTYVRALTEIQQGHKQSHWMWFIFPQLAGLGLSTTAKFYGIGGLKEAQAYINHPILGPRLIEIATAILAVNGKTATAILGTPDDLKLRSCMTLFSLLPQADPVFEAVLEKYYQGKSDAATLSLLDQQ